jgi:hypothetical protein
MVDLSISGKERFSAAGILMGATEQCLGEVKQCVSSPSIANIDQAGELQAPVPAILGQHVSLLQVVMAKHGFRAVLHQVEARLDVLAQAARQGLLPTSVAKLPERMVELRAHVFIVGRLGPPNAVGDDVTVSTPARSCLLSLQDQRLTKAICAKRKYREGRIWSAERTEVHPDVIGCDPAVAWSVKGAVERARDLPNRSRTDLRDA